MDSDWRWESAGVCDGDCSAGTRRMAWMEIADNPEDLRNWYSPLVSEYGLGVMVRELSAELQKSVQGRTPAQ